MPIEQLAVNASPLITLFRSGLAQILPALCPQIAVPDLVWKEVTAGGHADMATSGLVQASWANHLPASLIEPAVQAWDLGAGESAVLSHVYAHPKCTAVLDDAAARRCGRALGIQIIGTGGLLVIAKRKRIIPSVGKSLKQLKAAGLWLSPDVEQILLKSAQE